MDFAKTIKKLRCDKDMTQEQLAEYLNISTQAVSRWETNLSLPDISLLPALANIFDVSSDVLLGIDIESKGKRIRAIINEAFEHRKTANMNKTLDILRAGLKEYPNSYEIMCHIMKNLHRLSLTGGKNEVECNSFRKEAVYFGEKILENCTDDYWRYKAIVILCRIYPVIGEYEKAEEMAKKMPSMYQTREALLMEIYNGDKRLQFAKLYLNTRLSDFTLDLSRINQPLDDGSLPYGTDEMLVINKKIIALYEVIYEDGNFGFDRQRVWRRL